MKTAAFLFLLCSFGARLIAQQREEFNGPFAGWADVKTRFGARGNGKDDDTRAFQNAIDGLSNTSAASGTGNGPYAVVYIPAGVYCISSTLVLRGKIGVSIIGEDPARTIIKWIGSDGDTLLWTNGSAYFKIARLTLDANGRKEMEGIGIHWKDRWDDGKSRSYASLNIEIADCFFKGAYKYGISGGTSGGKGTGWNDSEITIRRCFFRGCTAAGIKIEGYNALDYWIWDCRFIHCLTGVNCMSGNYHVYRSFFSGSIICDVQNSNGYYTSVRGCYSEYSGAFSLDAGVSSNPFKRIFQDNVIIDPRKIAIEYYHIGKITLMDNKFTAATDTAFKCSVQTSCWPMDIPKVLSLGNTYQYKNPVKFLTQNHELYSFKDVSMGKWVSSSAAFLRTMDATPPKVRRTIFEVPAGINTDSIQAILNLAGLLKGQRAIVHFGFGTYRISKQLVIRAGSDLQLTGDGLLYASVLERSSQQAFRQQPMLAIKGPSYVTIRDLQFGKDGDQNQDAGILFTDVDQPGSEVHLDQVYTGADTSLFVDGLNYLYIEKDNSFFTAGNYIAGGNLVGQGRGTLRVCCYGGQFAGLTVKGNAAFVAHDCWWEGGRRVPLDISGSGNISIDGAMIAPAGADSLPTIRIGKFDGKISLMNMYVQGGLWVQGDNALLQLLIWNIHFYHKMEVMGFLKNPVNYKGAFLGINAQCFTANPACKSIIPIADRVVNVADLNAFLNGQTAEDRENKSRPVRNLARGVSNISISRVSLGAMKRGICFQ